MKKLLQLTLILFCAASTSFAQTNMDLEVWSPNGFGGFDPNGWGTLNGFMALGAPQSTFEDTTDPGQGSSAAKLESIYFPGASGFGAPSDTVGAMLSIGGPVGFGPLGIDYTKRPTSIDFLVKANIQGSDTGLVFVQFSHWDGSQTVVDGQGFMAFPASAPIPVWTSVSLPITFFTTSTPDTMQIVAASSGIMLGIVGVGSQAPGSQLFLDSFAIVLPANTAPVANDDAATTDSAVAVTVDVQANDTDAEGGAMTITVTVAPTNGTTSIVGSDVVYTPNAGFTGSDSFTYEVCDDGTPALCNTATVTITVVSPPPVVNMAPTAVDDAVSTDSAVAVTVDVQGNDTDPEGDGLTTTISAQGSNGTATVVSDSVQYTPDAGFVGVDTVVYQICDDGTPSECTTGNLVITVNSIPVGIENVISLSKFVLYPNPVSSDILNIKTSLKSESVFYIFDISGKQISSVTLKDELNEVNVSNLSSGLYFYQVTDKSGIVLTNGNFSVTK